MQSANATGSTESAVKADINVTPLVDVCLVLLIIFMVVTPLLIKGVDVQLPQTARPEKMPEGAKQLNVSIKADGTIFVGQDWVPKERLAARLKEIYSQSPDKNVVIKADKSLKYKEVRDIMRLLNEAGFPGVGLVAEREETR